MEDDKQFLRQLLVNSNNNNNQIPSVNQSDVDEQTMKARMEEVLKRLEANPAEFEDLLKELGPHMDKLNLPGNKSTLGEHGLEPKVPGINITPTAGFVVKTKSMNDSDENSMKIFINICQHDELGLPAMKKKIDENGEEVEGLNIPMSIGSGRVGADKSGVKCFIYDVIVNPKVIEDANADVTGKYRDFVCQLSIHGLEQKYNVNLDKRYKLPKLTKMGELLTQYIKDTKKMPKIEEVKSAPSKTNKNVKNNEHKEPITVIEKDLDYIISWVGGEVMDSDNPESLNTANLQPIKMIPNEYVEPTAAVDSKYLGLLFTCVLSSEIASRILSNISSSDTIDLQVSAYKLHLKIPSYKLLCLYLPAAITPSSCTCKVTQKESNIGSVELFIKMPLDKSEMDKEADVGSKAWLISQALRSEENRSSNSTSTESKATNDNEFPEDKFHIKLPDNVNQYTGLKEETNDDVLPEERFHMKDAHSTFLINQREQSIKDKQEHFENEKKNRKNDENVEYVDIDDFKPGGKYASNSSKPGSTPDVTTNVIEPMNKVKEVILSNNNDMVVLKYNTQSLIYLFSYHQIFVSIGFKQSIIKFMD